MGLINNRKEAQAWQQKHDANAPKVGDAAPDFSLSDVENQNTVQLSEFKGKRPVALIFGSFT